MSSTQGNSIYSLSTPQGASAEACCNTCYFEVPYCIQAYWYFYEGCVVNQVRSPPKKIIRFKAGDQSLKAFKLQARSLPRSDMLTWHFSQADTVTGSGEGLSTTCPQGTVEGLVYSNDTNAAFRSTGDFAGPCGQTYEDLPY